MIYISYTYVATSFILSYKTIQIHLFDCYLYNRLNVVTILPILLFIDIKIKLNP